MIGRTAVGYTVDDLESGLRHLKDLLSVICTLQFDAMPGEPDARIDSLLWIAEGIAQAVYRHNNTDAGEERP